MTTISKERRIRERQINEYERIQEQRKKLRNELGRLPKQQYRMNDWQRSTLVHHLRKIRNIERQLHLTSI